VTSSFRLVGAARVDEFVARGYKRRHFFPHRVYHLPKCGPDGFKLASWMCGIKKPSSMWEIVLYAEREVLGEFPPELFFDDELVWHQQQFGRVGQVATASLVVKGATVSSITHVSDLFQRISRRRQYKTRVEKVFAGWNHMLLNAVLAFAIECGAKRVRLPMASLAGRHTDRSRNVNFTIFERIYDRTVNSLFAPRAAGEWWVLDLAAVHERVVVPERRVRTGTRPKTVSICHDIERALGHQKGDPGFVRAQRFAPDALRTMNATEAALGIRATYCVVGSLMNEVRAELEAERHCIAFHSFDHDLKRRDQLRRCREVDYRIKGYRPPRSRITRELKDRNLLFHNFEWLASSPHSLGTSVPVLTHGLVKLPITLDDFPLYRNRALAFDEWAAGALQSVADSEFTAISLHDCYADRWLSHYRGFLERISELAEHRTLNEVAEEITLDSAV
jgi:hypothetical protein